MKFQSYYNSIYLSYKMLSKTHLLNWSKILNSLIAFVVGLEVARMFSVTLKTNELSEVEFYTN